MNDARPQVCSEANLACEDCAGTTARELAKVCKGLRGKMIGQLFVQIYTDPACARMHGHFADAYRNADAEGNQAKEVDAGIAVRKPVTPAYERREVTFARPRTLAAIA